MAAFRVKVLYLVFFLSLHVISLKISLTNSLETPIKSHFFQDFFEMASNMGEDSEELLKELLQTIEDYAIELKNSILLQKSLYAEKYQNNTQYLVYLKNESEFLIHEAKRFGQQISDNSMKLDEVQRNLEYLQNSKEQIIQMKMNESQVFHKKLQEKTEVFNEAREIYQALVESREALTNLLTNSANSSENSQVFLEKREILINLKTKKKTLKSTELLNFLLINEPFIKMAILTEVVDEETINKIIEKLQEMIEFLIKNYGHLPKEIAQMNQTYQNRVQNLYEEYVTLKNEMVFLESQQQLLESLILLLFLIQFKKVNLFSSK